MMSMIMKTFLLVVSLISVFADSFVSAAAAAAEVTNNSTRTKNITLRTALYLTEPFVYQDNNNGNSTHSEAGEDIKWIGYIMDVADLLIDQASRDGYDLTFDIDYENGILSNIPNVGSDADSGIDYLTDDCNVKEEANDCYDFIIGVYKRTPERQGKVISLPPQFITYLLSVVRNDSGIKSMEDVKSGNGTLCTTELVLEYSGFGNTSESCSPVYVCATQDECFRMLMNDDGCDLFVDYADMARYSSTQEPEKYSDLEVVDNIVPTDGVKVVEWICFPINPNLPSETTVMMSKWMYEIYASGVLGDLHSKYFGEKQDFSRRYPSEITVTSGVYRNKPQAYQDEADGSWMGIVFEAAASITKSAEKDGVKLTIEIDTAKNGIVSDIEGEIGTPTGSLATISSDCNDTNASHCFDMILGAYSVTPMRQKLATFTPPYMESFITTIRRPSSSYNTISQINSAGGSVCIWDGSYVDDVVSPLVNTPIKCATQDDCYNMVKNGKCDMTADDYISALARVAQDPDELVEMGVVPGMEDFLAFPMKTSLDPSVQIAITNWVHDYTHGMDFTTVGAVQLNDEKDITAGNTIPQNNQESPTTAPTTSSGHGESFLFVGRLRNQSMGLLIAAIGFAALLV